MTAQDRYISGVPCWIDTTQPDPEAAVTASRFVPENKNLSQGAAGGAV